MSVYTFYTGYPTQQGHYLGGGQSVVSYTSQCTECAADFVSVMWQGLTDAYPEVSATTYTHTHIHTCVMSLW